jgi:hypothetical protein
MSAWERLQVRSRACAPSELDVNLYTANLHRQRKEATSKRSNLTMTSKFIFDVAGSMPDHHAQTIMSDVRKLAKSGDSGDDVLEGYLALLGMGGSSENAKGTFGFVLNNNRYELESLRKIVRGDPYKATLRQFARAVSDNVHDSLAQNKLTPPVASKIGLKDAQVYWGFDFADRSNNCPDEIKQKLQTHLEKALDRRNIRR